MNTSVLNPVDYPKILIVGKSGSGKSTSFRNLTLPHVGFINTEAKLLPFSKKGFGHYEDLLNVQQLKTRLVTLNTRKDLSVIIIDGLTLWGESLVSSLGNRLSGWDLYGEYNQEISKVIEQIKKMNKVVILTAIAEVLESNVLNSQGQITTTKEFSASVQGQKKKGKVEANFTVVFFTTKKQDAYVFETNNGKDSPAKSPMGMYKEQFIPNDMAEVLPTITNFYDLPRVEEMAVEKPKQETKN